MNSREPTIAEPTGAPSPFEKHTEMLSNGAAIARALARASPPSATAALKSREAAPPRERARLHEIGERQHLAAGGVLQAEQPALRVVRVVGLDRLLDRRQRQRAVGRVLERLRLDTAERRRAAALPAIRVRHLADDVFVAAAAMREDRDQVALRAAGDIESRLLAEHRRDPVLQRVDARVVAEDVVADFGSGHRRAHRRGRPRHRVAPEIDHAARGHCGGAHRVASRKFFSIA